MAEERSKREKDEENGHMQKRLKKLPILSEICYNSEPPTLKNLTIISIATRLWMQPALIEQLEEDSELLSFTLPEYYRKLEEVVSAPIVKSCLPSALKDEILCVIRPIGTQLSKWFYTESSEYNSLHGLRELGGSIYWTMEGTIDGSRSTNELILDENTKKNARQLFELASMFCLDERISNLWFKLSSEERTDIYKRCIEQRLCLAVEYWMVAAQFKFCEMLELTQRDLVLQLYELLFSWLINNEGVVAFKYFWQKLTKEETDEMVEEYLDLVMQKIRLIPRYNPALEYDSVTGILCFLLPYLGDQNQQIEFFQNNSYPILRALFRSWPHQRSFSRILLSVLDYIEEDVYVSIICDIFEEVDGIRFTEEIFNEIWRGSSWKLKEAFLQDCKHECVYRLTKVLLLLIKIGDKVTAFRVLNETSAKKKGCIISELLTHGVLDRFIYLKNKLTLFDPFFKELLPPEQDIQSFKLEVLEKYTYSGYVYENFQELEYFSEKSQRDFRNIKTSYLKMINVYISLIFQDDYDHITHLMKWYFETDGNIREFKRFFVSEYNICYLNVLLLELGSRWNGWYLFENFLNFNMPSFEETNAFKIVCLKCVEYIEKNNRFEFAAKLLSWCLDTTHEINLPRNEQKAYRTGWFLEKSGAVLCSDDK